MRVLSAFALAAGLGCGCASTHSVAVRTQVAVSIDPSPPTPLFNPRGIRLVSAYQQLERIAGHSIAFEIDAAITPDSRSSFEDVLIAAFESVARDLNELAKVEPAAHRFGLDRLTRIEIRYDGTRRTEEVRLDALRRTLVIRGPAQRGALVGRGVVYRALLSTHDRDRSARYEGRSPDSIPPEQRLDYFRWLTSHDRRRGAQRSAATEPYESSEATLTLSVLQLARLNQPPAADLAEKIREWLLSRGSYFAQRYAHDPRAVMDLPADAPFNQAARAWTEWALGAYSSLDDDERLRMARELFVRSFQVDRPLTQRSYPPFAWPGADLFALGLTEVDRWRSIGHPTQLTNPRCSPALDFFVCSRAIDARSGATVAPNCDEDWYRYALETQGRRKRLLAAMTTRSDPIFTETVFKNVRSATERPLDTLLVMLRDVETDPAIWGIGWSVVAYDYVNTAFDLVVLEESRRLWVAYPERRGILLAGLVRMDRGGRGNVDWKGFAVAFGGPIASNEFADYLEADKSALFDASLVWPALGQGWSRAALVVPRLDEWLARAKERDLLYQNPYQSLQNLIGQMCREKATGDLTRIREYLEVRKRAHPGEPYVRLIASTREKECQPAPLPPPPRNEVKLSPLKQGLPPLRIIQTGAE